MGAVEHEVELIDAVGRRLRERLPEAGEAAVDFLPQFLRGIPEEDLARRSAEDLAGVVATLWQLAGRLSPGAHRLRIFNPERERDGFASPHTVVHVLCDDMPFLVDSVTMELTRQGFPIDLVVHPVLWVERAPDGRLLRVLPAAPEGGEARRESIMHIEVLRTRDRAALERLEEGLTRVLGDVRKAVEDWGEMRSRLHEAASDLGDAPGEDAVGDPAEAPLAPEEVRAFLSWLDDGHFTFLGYREYDLVRAGVEGELEVRPETGLGILRGGPPVRRRPLRARALALATGPSPVVLTKANSRSTVHRPSYLDYIGVKRYDPAGAVIGERRFLGLYTTSAYRAAAAEIPILRRKVASVLGMAGLPPGGHDAKALLDILESYPRDALLAFDAEELFRVTTGILALGERRRVRLFVTRDPLERFLDCLVCIPRDRLDTQTRERMGEILCEAYGARQLDWSVQRTASLLARINYIVRPEGGIPDTVAEAEVERRLLHAARAWGEDLRVALIERHGEERGTELHSTYGEAFPPGYRAEWEPAAAVFDIGRLEALEGGPRPLVELYRPAGLEGEERLRCKLFSAREVALSDVVPTFEHMGARVVEERPHRISPAHGRTLWIYDFGLRCATEDLEGIRTVFEDALLRVLAGELEDDALGALVLRAGLTGEQIELLRAIARYLRQAGIPFSDAYLQRTVVAHPQLARQLVELFDARLRPPGGDAERAGVLRAEIEAAIGRVESLDEDRILRAFHSVVMATLRTNRYARRDGGGDGGCLALKLDPGAIPLLPRPRPQFEIWVYSPRVEGVHLRGGRVARGGLRWSDRPEDFRTEILGLMKAQMVKNAVIVPVGSKGGFVLKRAPREGGAEALRREAIACYEIFLGGLLDLTDNIVEGRVLPPAQVLRRDEDDPYLVVAADKGTASFSDIANGVSRAYGFWLGDAFASGGSHGYDHKAMGITARGAWESVKRHFRELGRDIQRESLTVVGIGDMSGDVFGNGMLLSRQIKLVAAFNHQHVFLDPDPDPEQSFAERHRLFGLERSSWADYDPAAISAGGGVHSRAAKVIPVSEPARRALGIEEEELSPDEVISAILRAPADLLWNGGIGTYVKAAAQSHAEVGDRANDSVRVDGEDLRLRVVGEGGNLGFTQLGRIEYARTGGRIYTDAIDNAGGVNCSDHEVNIKILLDAAVAAGKLDLAERNALLAEMTQAVAEAVIHASYTQTQALSLALAQAGSMVDVHAREIRHLESAAGLDRELEALPTEPALDARRSEQSGLLAPELAVLLAHAKISLYSALLHSDLPEDPYLEGELERYFPAPLPARFPGIMREHRLRREIIATTTANELVDRAGSTFAYRLGDETGAAPAHLARAYIAAREILDMPRFWGAVEELDNRVSAGVQAEMLIEARRLVERSTRWLVQWLPPRFAIDTVVARFAPGAARLDACVPDVLEQADREIFNLREAELRAAGVPRVLSAWVAGMGWRPALFDLIDVAEEAGREVDDAITVHFHLGGSLELNWLGDRINELPRGDRWQTLARAALREELLHVHRALTHEVLASARRDGGTLEAIDAWEALSEARVERWRNLLGEIRATRSYDTTTLPVALREARKLLGSPLGVSES